MSENVDTLILEHLKARTAQLTVASCTPKNSAISRWR